MNLTPTDKQKIKNFISDKVMSGAVHDVLLDSFLKKGDTTDVQTLAAERIAINLLHDGFKSLKKYASENTQETKTLKQVGM